MVFVCHLALQDHEINGFVVLWAGASNGNPVTFGGYRVFGSGDIIFLVVEERSSVFSLKLVITICLKSI